MDTNGDLRAADPQKNLIRDLVPSDPSSGHK